MSDLQHQLKITDAQIFAAQSELCVDDPLGEFTSVTPDILFEWAADKIENIQRAKILGGNRAISIAYTDKSSAVIVECDDGSLMVSDGQTIMDGILHPGVEHEEDWGLITVETPEGQRYMEHFNKLFSDPPE